MSYVVTIKTSLKDKEALKKVCLEKGLKFEQAADGSTLTRQLYSGPVSGVVAFEPKGWRYPVVVDQDGGAKYDNYHGAWGQESELDDVRQGYAKEVAVGAARRQGFRVESQHTLQDGSLQLVLSH